MGIIARYSGQLYRTGLSHADLAIDPGWGAAALVKVEVTFRRDDKNQELVEYTIDGKHRLAYFLGSDGQYDRGGAALTLRPIGQAAAPITLGFLLPSNISRTFIRQGINTLPKFEEPCSQGDSDCTDVVMMAGHSGTVFHGQWHKTREEALWRLRGQQEVAWNLKFGTEPVPESISYTDKDLNGAQTIKASATYKLISYSSTTELLSKNQFTGKSAITVMVGRDGYGPFDHSTDPWAFHKRESQKWAKLAHSLNKTSAGTSWIPVASVAAGIIVVLTILLIRSRR